MTSDTETQQVSLSFAKRYRNELGLVIALILVVVGTIGANLLLHGTADYVNEPTRNLKDILHQTALLGIFALGAAIVIISGGIDLSSGSMIVFAGSICGLVMLVLAPKGDDMLPDATDVGLTVVSVAIFVTMVVGLMVGTVHTWLITVVRLPPFVATLASLVGLRSLAKILNQAVTAQLGNQVTTVRADDATFAYLSDWWVALVIFIVLGILCWFLMNATVIGRHLYAMGGNEEAARLSGIRHGSAQVACLLHRFRYRSHSGCPLHGQSRLGKPFHLGRWLRTQCNRGSGRRWMQLARRCRLDPRCDAGSPIPARCHRFSGQNRPCWFGRLPRHDCWFFGCAGSRLQ